MANAILEAAAPPTLRDADGWASGWAWALFGRIGGGDGNARCACDARAGGASRTVFSCLPSGLRHLHSGQVGVKLCAALACVLWAVSPFRAPCLVAVAQHVEAISTSHTAVTRCSGPHADSFCVTHHRVPATARSVRRATTRRVRESSPRFTIHNEESTRTTSFRLPRRGAHATRHGRAAAPRPRKLAAAARARAPPAPRGGQRPRRARRGMVVAAARATPTERRDATRVATPHPPRTSGG
jgi:hypothetical protein